MNIQGYASLSGISPATKIQDNGKQTTGSNSFGAMLNAYIDQTNHNEKVSDKAATVLAAGKGGNTSETLLAIEKADISFKMMMSVRNKLVDAYREISRMQV